MRFILTVVGAACLAGVFAWQMSAVLLKQGMKNDFFRALFHEIKPFYLPMIPIGYVSMVMTPGSLGFPYGTLVWAGVAVMNWFFLRDADDDDDRWKRRKRRATEIISRAGSRLVAVPVASEG